VLAQFLKAFDDGIRRRGRRLALSKAKAVLDEIVRLIAKLLGSGEVAAHGIFLQINFVVPDKEPDDPQRNGPARLKLGLGPPARDEQCEVSFLKFF
jgi:hypothetical protein